jgi:pimeloyl-ACP methyl ester carboxylesterase
MRGVLLTITLASAGVLYTLAQTSESTHWSCAGAGKPPVILEAGAGRGGADWDKVRPGIAETTQVCSYDRASGKCCDQVVDDLHALLRNSHVIGPYILVGHSLGGLYVRRFAGRFPDEVSGLVLVDSADEKQLTGIIAPGLKPELYRPGAMSDAELREFFQELGRRMKAANATQANTAGDSGEREIQMARFYRQIASERREFQFGDMPLIVLTATRQAFMPRFSEDQVAQLADDHRILQERMQRLSKDSRQVLVPESGHFIHQDRPDAVVAAIREVVAVVRRGARLSPDGK